MKSIFTVILIIILACSFGEKMSAQNSKIDSLLIVLKNTKSDTAKIRVYLQLGNACDVNDNLKYADPAIKLIDECLAKTSDSLQRGNLLSQREALCGIKIFYYSTKEGNSSPKVIQCLKEQLNISEKYQDPQAIVAANLKVGNFYFETGEMSKRLEYLERGYDQMKNMNFKRGMSRFIMQLSFFYADLGDTIQALEYYEKATILEKEINDTSRVSRGFFLAGKFYAGLNRFDKAIELYLKGVDKYKAKGDRERLAELYYYLADAHLKKRNYNIALDYYNSCIELESALGVARYKGPALIAIGDVYALQGNLEKAIETHNALFVSCEKDNIEGGIQASASALAKDYFKTKNYKKAKPFIERALSISYKFETIRDILDGEELAYKIDSADNNYKDAYKHYQKFISLKNKLNDQELQKATARSKFKNGLEKQKLESKVEQDKKDAIAAEEKQKQNIIIYSISGGLCLVLVLVVFVFRSYKQKQKANEELTSKNQLIEQQKHLVEEKHKEITDSINYAERIQRSFLATTEMLDKNLDEYFIFFKPKDVVSGDFYWAASTADRFYFATADSTGHGVPGAIMSLLNITSLEKAIEHHSDPAEILNHTRKTIINRLKKDGSPEGGKDGMDCSLLSFNFQTKKLNLAAANNPVWIIRKDESGVTEAIEVKPDKMPVGKHDKDDQPFTLQSFDLKKNDVVYALTDGFPDQFGGENGKKFMSKKLRELLVANAHLPMVEQKLLLESTFTKWIGNLEQVDDVTVVGIRI